MGFILHAAALLVNKTGVDGVPPSTGRRPTVPIATALIIHPNQARARGVVHGVAEVGGRRGA